jgi:hypothetical protein
VILSEPEVAECAWRNLSDGIVGNLLEFAVHAPAMLSALGFDDYSLVSPAALGEARIKGPKCSGTVRRPGKLSKELLVDTTLGVLRADGVARSATLGKRTVAFKEGVPPYAGVVAGVLDWLDGGRNRSDLWGQVNALGVLTGDFEGGMELNRNGWVNPNSRGVSKPLIVRPDGKEIWDGCAKSTFGS